MHVESLPDTVSYVQHSQIFAACKRFHGGIRQPLTVGHVDMVQIRAQFTHHLHAKVRDAVITCQVQTGDDIKMRIARYQSYRHEHSFQTFYMLNSEFG